MKLEEIKLLTEIYQHFNIKHKDGFRFIKKHQRKFKLDNEIMANIINKFKDENLIEGFHAKLDNYSNLEIIRDNSYLAVTLEGLIVINRELCRD